MATIQIIFNALFFPLSPLVTGFIKEGKQRWDGESVWSADCKHTPAMSTDPISRREEKTTHLQFGWSAALRFQCWLWTTAGVPGSSGSACPSTRDPLLRLSSSTPVWAQPSWCYCHSEPWEHHPPARRPQTLAGLQLQMIPCRNIWYGASLKDQ